MSSSTKAPDRVPTAVSVEVDEDWLRVGLADGRELTVPLDWFLWLHGATDADKADLHLIEDGLGIWWESIDEGLSVPWLFGLPHHFDR